MTKVASAEIKYSKEAQCIRADNIARIAERVTGPENFRLLRATPEDRAEQVVSSGSGG